MSKYNAKRTTVDGITFASKLEAKRYGQLKLMERAGVIKHLVLQPSWELSHGPIRIDPKKRRFTAKYTADFEYWDAEKDLRIIEEVKGVWTEAAKVRVAWWMSSYPETAKCWVCLTKDEI